MRLVAHIHQRPTSVFTESITTQTIMSDKKRKSASAAADGPSAKQQKVAPMMKEVKEKAAGGWLKDQVKQQRTEMKEMKFNKKRIRYISDSQKIKQGSEGVLYWMLRDHRVQGKHLKQLPVNRT